MSEESRSDVVEILANRASRRDLVSLIGKPSVTEFVGSERSDTSLLRLMSFHILGLSMEDFGVCLDELIDNLERRTQFFEDEETLTFDRLDGWCSVLNNAAGFLYVANRRFLYRLGTPLTDFRPAQRLEAMVVAGLGELDRRFDRKVRTPAEWAAVSRDQDSRPRRHLANAINYLARDGFALRSGQALTLVTESLGDTHLDVLVQSAGFPTIPFSDRTSPLCAAMRRAVRQLEEYFDPGTTPSYLDLMYNPTIKSAPAALLYHEFTRAASNLGLDDAISDVQRVMGLAEREASATTGRQSDVVERLLAQPPVADDTGRLLTLTERLDEEFGKVMSFRDRTTRARLLNDLGERDAAIEVFPSIQGLSHVALPHFHAYLLLAPQLLDSSDFDLALYEATRLIARLSDVHLHDVNFLGRAIQISDLVEDQRVIENANEACNLLARSTKSTQRSPEGQPIVLFAIEQDRVTPALVTPVLAVLREAGVPAMSLQTNRFLNDLVTEWPYSPRLTANCSALVGCELAQTQMFKDWTIDLDHLVVEADGVNYYEGIYERVARILKVYNVDWELPGAQVWFRLSLQQIDRTVAALDQVRAVADERDLRIRLVSLQSHFAPFSAQRAYCEAHSERLEHITLSSSYENWKTNVGGEPLSSLTMLNNTRHPEPSFPAFGRRDHFDEWFRTEFEPNEAHYLDLARNLTSMERAGARSAEADSVIEMLEADRAAGRRVFCLLGKIPYDLGVPYQGGPAHESMGDWVAHSVETISSTEHRLLVKPHPHELNLSISAQPIESFVDLVPGPTAENVTILPHRGVNLQDLAAHVDVFLCWNGSSIAELGSQGLKVIAADDWAGKNYPLHVCQPSDRSDYEGILLGEREVKMHPDFQRLSAAYVGFLTEAPFAIRYPFVDRSSTNTLFNRATVDFSSLDEASLDSLRSDRHRILDTFGASEQTVH